MACCLPLSSWTATVIVANEKNCIDSNIGNGTCRLTKYSGWYPTTSGNVVETEEQVSLKSIPAGARTAIEKYAAGGKVLNVEVVTRDTVTSYEAQVQKAAKKSEVKLSPEGSLLK